MKYIFSILLCVILQTGFSQIYKTVGISYTAGTPTYTPAKAGSWLALDTVTWRYYTYNGSTWVSDGFRIQSISGCSAPAYTPTKFQSLFVINACTVMQGGPELYYWNGSTWVQINEGQTYTAGTGIDITGAVISATAPGGPDSALVKTNGSYLNKRITDNLYKNGTLGLRTTDTTGVFNIFSTANTTKPSISVKYDDASSNTYRFFELSPTNQVNDPSVGKFVFFGSNFPNANLPYSIRGDHVWRWGYNIGRFLSTDASIEMAIESNYYAQILGKPVSRNQEVHIEQTDTLGVTHRIYTAAASHNGLYGDAGMNTDGLYLSRYNGGQKWLLANRFNKTWDYQDTMQIRFSQPQVGTAFMRFKKADNSGYFTMFQSDASNRLVICPEVNDVYYNTRNFIFSTENNIYTDDGSNLNVGKIGKGTPLVITSNQPAVQQFRTQTSGYFRFDINNFSGGDNFQIVRPGEIAAFTLYSTAVNGLLSLRSTSIGINNQTPAASAALDITSTTQGLLPPRMTAAQRDAISAPATGLSLYCTDCTATDASTGVMQTYNGATWKNNW